MIAAALRIYPDDGILWAMFLRLLFGPESHQDLRRLRASCEGERKSREEQSRREPREQTAAPCSAHCRAEELVNRGVAHAHLFRDMVGIAAGCRRDSAFGVRPANKGCICEDTLPFMGFGAQQEPLDCIFLRRIGLCNNLADERGTIGHLPGRTGEVSADLPVLLVEENCLRRREGPLEEASFSFAGIDL